MNLPYKLFDRNMHLPHVTKNLHRDEKIYKNNGEKFRCELEGREGVVRAPQQEWIFIFFEGHDMEPCDDASSFVTNK